jgi:poly-gamma-glutamate synthesis protein (capsule biosynthesis protein)
MQPITLFLCGDVMTGRGIDQILSHPSDPALHEGFVRSALGYVALAESEHGPIPRGVAPEYIWGDALGEFERVQPDARVVNLETAVTGSEDWLDKGINYRMHPANVTCLTAARIDCCGLANNHVLDWGRAGLLETLDALRAAGLRTAGAGRNRTEARALAEIPLARGGRVLVAALGMPSSGVPGQWAATDDAPGVAVLEDLSERNAERIARSVRAVKRPGDVVVASIHWGGNWGYAIGRAERRFAQRLIDAAGVDLVHGHSSHHPKAIEVHAGKLVLYGCGDFINDYEGISGYESYRGDLGLMYFPTLDATTGHLMSLALVPTQLRRFRVQRASAEDARWLADLLAREGRQLGTGARLREDGRIELTWDG